MRKPRRETLGKTGLFHKMWRGHNREPIFEEVEDRRAYVDALNVTYTDEVKRSVAWYSICLMTTHTHESGRNEEKEGDLEESIKALGDWMRNAHSRFGAKYNRRHDRQGKVAYDRPKTKEIEDDEGVLTVMFYNDANPVRAGVVSHPSHYRDSTHRYYAYGEKSRLSEKLTPPPAYLALGKTPEARQKRYRQLCDAYLRGEGYIDDRPSEEVTEPVESDVESGKALLEGDQDRSRGHPTEGR